MLNVFDYEDYRDFLREFYHQKKVKTEGYSLAKMAAEAQVSSRGLLKLIMDGKRNLTTANLDKMLKGFVFNKSESHYFETLVKYNQAKGFEEKNKYYEILLKFPQKKKSNQLKLDQYNFYSKWYYSAIYELVLLKDCPRERETFYGWVHDRMEGRVTPKEIQTAVAEMEALNLLRWQAGRLVQSHSYIESQNSDVINFAIQNFHQQMIQEASKSLSQSPAQREFGSVTLAFKKEDLGRAKLFIQEFRKNFNFDFSALEGADSVYQLNIQFFELAKGEVKQRDQSQSIDPNFAKEETKRERSAEIK